MVKPMLGLDDMVKSVNMERGVSAIVLADFRKIALARKHFWTWAQITAAIRADYPDAPAMSESAVQSAFKRIERGIQNRRIKPINKTPTSTNVTATAKTTAQPAQTLEIQKKAEYRTGAEIISKASNFETLS